MNTHPNTPFGKFFDKIGIWHASFEQGIIDLYSKLHDTEKEAVKNASGWIAVINANLQTTPDELFAILQQKFPGITKERITDFINKINAQIQQVDASIPADFAAALKMLQDYLSKHDGNTWIAITRAVVSVGADILLNGKSAIVAIETVLEYVYQTFVKGKII